MMCTESGAFSRDSIFYKSFRVSGLDGWYLEFGVFAGKTFRLAYQAAKTLVNDVQGGCYSHGIGSDNKEKRQQALSAHFGNLWSQMRFVAFDSFEGIPGNQTSVDKYYEHCPQGAFACGEQEFVQNLLDAGVNLTKVVVVPGFYEKTLTPETASKIGLKTISVAHIDSDLYSSAKLALDFCTPYFRDGSIVIFDDWFLFRGNPFLGERRAFSEWQRENPSWYVSDYSTQGPWSKAFILSRHPDLKEE